MSVVTKEGASGGGGGDQSSVGISTVNNQQQAFVDDDDDSLNHENKPNGTLYVAPIERYVDDGELYKQKYSDYSRIKYWEFLLDRHRPPRLPFGHQSWASQGGNNNFGEEIHHYPSMMVSLLASTVHHYWDYMYLYLLGAWILLMTAHYDPLIREYVLIPIELLYFPLLLMVFTQLIPTLSVIYLVTRCNDLVKLVASRTFGSWVRPVSRHLHHVSLSLSSQAFTAVMLAQYLEYTYYSGHKRADKAGKCRLEYEEDWTDLDLDGNPKMKLKSNPGPLSRFLRSLRRRDSKISPSQGEGGGGDGEEDGVDDEERGEEGEENNSSSDSSSLEEMRVSPTRMSPKGAHRHGGGSARIETGRGTSPSRSTGRGTEKDDESVLTAGGSTGIPMGLEGGYLQRMKEEAEAAELAQKRAALEEIQRREALVTDWHQWKCLVCGKQNRRPRHPLTLSFTPTYYEKGVYLKKLHTTLVPDRDVPSCEKCYTPADYHPRLCTAHIFPHYKHPYEAFDNYPEAAPHHLPSSKFSTFLDKTKSCLFGQRNHPDSRLMVNDWRMSIYLSSRFPLVPRPVKGPHELFLVGEVIECKKQKMDWCRGRIVESRSSGVYDIIYDTGDEVRMIEEHELRLPPSKGLYAYRVELALAILVLTIPLSLMAAIAMNSPGIAFFPLTIFSTILLFFRLFEFLESFSEYYAAGCCLIFQQHLLLSYPLILVFLASVLLLTAAMNHIPILVLGIFLIMTMFASLPVIYLKRPTFAVMTSVIFVQLGLSIFLISYRLTSANASDGSRGTSFVGPWVMIDTFPALTSVYTLIRYRRWLTYVWDVSLIIRPTEYSEYEVSSLRQFYDIICELMRGGGRGGGGTGEEEKDEEKGDEEEGGGVRGRVAGGGGKGKGKGGTIPSLEMAALGNVGTESERKKKEILGMMSDDEGDGDEQVSEV
jgi:hypothetical protein